MSKTKSSVLAIIAKLISHLLGFGSIVLLCVIAIYSGKFSRTDFIWILVAVGFVLISGVMLLILVKYHIFKDFDLTDRRERPLFLFFITILTLIILFTYIIYDVDKVLQFVAAVYFIEMILNFIITLFWKISNHAIMVTNFVLFAISLLGMHYWFLFFLIPLVCWSRLYLKKHTFLQFVAGTVLPFIVMIPLVQLYNLW